MIATRLFPERDCTTCTALKKRDYGCEARLETGPDGTSKWIGRGKHQILIDGKPDWSCPRRPWLDDPEGLFFLMDVYAHYQNGFLPEQGGVLDQPAKLMRMLAIIGKAHADCDEQQQAEAKKRARMEKDLEQVKGRKRTGHG